MLDFGLAAVRGLARMTEVGTAVGTPLYMSPEQLRGLPPDNRSDLWALGAILHQALTGARARGRECRGDGARGDELATAAALAIEPGGPGPLDFVVEKLLRKDPALRYARAEDLIVDLASIGRTLAAGGGPSTAATVAMPAERPAPRIAVLYFEAMSTDPDDAFLAAGLTEDLIVDLARVEGLRVAARGEVQPFRGRDLPPRTVARELGVEFVVQGSVRRAGRRARINAQLVRAADGHATWAERFDRTIEDLFDVQAEVSQRIVDALQVTLRPAERELLNRAPTKDREAYALYLRGRALMDENRRSSNLRAEECLRQAIERDPRFALAHATLAECYGSPGDGVVGRTRGGRTGATARAARARAIRTCRTGTWRWATSAESRERRGPARGNQRRGPARLDRSPDHALGGLELPDPGTAGAGARHPRAGAACIRATTDRVEPRRLLPDAGSTGGRAAHARDDARGAG